ncbi:MULTISPECIES: hypothetical protein [Gordonia]|uniref:hypothetical protein n=1 Tax=Gordonia TaxID=2053 RepID=UPI002043CB2F|nr:MULTISPECIES: hypothetical protein [Gordonia]MCM3895181.1 hypothetical protein [Gordonia sputi]
MKRKIIAGVLAAGAAATVAAGPVSAAPAPDPLSELIGTLLAGSSDPNPGAPVKPSPNGVASMSVKVYSWFGRDLGPALYDTGFAPGVVWSARDRSNAEVKGKNCQIEVQYPGTGYATYKTAECQGDVGSNTKLYRTPGHYSIVVVDRVSGASKTSSFTIE